MCSERGATPGDGSRYRTGTDRTHHSPLPSGRLQPFPPPNPENPPSGRIENGIEIVFNKLERPDHSVNVAVGVPPDATSLRGCGGEVGLLVSRNAPEAGTNPVARTDPAP